MASDLIWVQYAFASRFSNYETGNTKAPGQNKLSRDDDGPEKTHKRIKDRDWIDPFHQCAVYLRN